MFQKVNEPGFLEGEHDVLRFWREQDVFRRLQRQNAGKPKWSFLDGPITANNPMGVHHAWGRTYKDAYQRYRAMCGHDLRYQNGFDCQGLWVEVEVEKELKLGTKSAIIAQGIDKFVHECKKRVLRFAARQTEQSVRLGYWMEWDDPDELRKLADAIGKDSGFKIQDSGQSDSSLRPEVTYTNARGDTVTGPAEQLVARLGNPEWGGSYFTFSTENNETIWAFLKKCFERKKIYRGHDVMPWSGRGGSAYSQMEVADGRKLTTHRSCFVRFPLIVDKEDKTTETRRHTETGLKEYLLIWTTTPWTLTSNVAAAVNPDLDYVRIKAQIRGDDQPAIYYFAKDNLNYKRLEKEFKEGFGRPEWHWPHGVDKLKTISQIFKEQGGFEELGTIQGAEMVGWRYAGPFDDLEAQNGPGGYPASGLSGAQAHRVIDGGRDSKGSPNVVAGEGTGIVHVAPGCGDIDHKIGVELGLPVIAPLQEDGTYGEGFGPFTGREAIAPDTADLVFEELKKKGLLIYVETYPHIYPHCWRTGDELVFRLVDEWFINMDWRDEIKEVTKTINWIPESIQGQERELEWLTTMRDWMISKKRFWGLALPIWINRDDPSDFEVIGSLAELKERALNGGAGWDQFEGHTPHRPWIDVVKIRSRKTGALLSRIEDVGNPWLDAGIVPFSTLNYNERYPTDLTKWSDWFPADLVTECFPGQFRNWFYSLLALATMMRYDETDDPAQKRPFKNLLGHRLVMDESGNPMHKSDGTAIWFEEAAEQLGVDTLRWMYLAQNPAVDLKFGTRHPGEPVTLQTPEGPVTHTKEGLPCCKVTSKPADEIRRQVLIPLWNSYAFFVNYAVLDGFDPSLTQVPLADRPEIDRWILSRLQELIQTAHDSFQNYRVADFMQAAAEYIDDLSNWYIRRNRRRFWKARRDDSGAGIPEPGSLVDAGVLQAKDASAEEQFRAYLSTKKLGMTRERTTIVREVFASSEAFTAQQLLVRLSRYAAGKKVGRSAVYKSLEQLIDSGLVELLSQSEEPSERVYRPSPNFNVPCSTNSLAHASGSERSTLNNSIVADHRTVRDNSWDPDKLAAYQTLYEVLVTLSKLLAPAIPFLTERMYRNLVEGRGSKVESVNDGSSVVPASGGCQPPDHPTRHAAAQREIDLSSSPISVHLCEYPTVDSSKFDPDLNWKTHQVQTLVRMAHRLREAAELRVRQPLAELRFATPDVKQAAALEQYKEVIADELNVKQVVRAENLDDLVHYSFKPNLKTLGPKYGKLLNLIRNELGKVDPHLLSPLRQGQSVTLTLAGNEIVLAPDDVMVSVEQASDWASADDGGIQIALSTHLTQELVLEGMARDMIRHVQQLRKDANLEENQRITILWRPTSKFPAKEVEAMLAVWTEIICAETRADKIEHVDAAPDNARLVTLGDVEIALAIVF